MTRSSMLLFAVCTIELTACLLPLEDQNLQGTPETSTAPNPGPLTAYPTPFICQAGVIEQVFQFGRMFWVGATLDERCRETHEFAPGVGQIWVLIFAPGSEGGAWLVFTDDWDASVQPELDPLLTPLPGLLQPVRGFGWVWRERLSAGQREALGWATGVEIAYSTQYRYESGGTVDQSGQFILQPGQHALYDMDGGLFFLDEITQTFDYIPAQ